MILRIGPNEALPMRQTIPAVACIAAMLLSLHAHGQSTKPLDNKITEAQLKLYLETAKDLPEADEQASGRMLRDLTAMGKMGATRPEDFAQVTQNSRQYTQEEHQAVFDRHHLTLQQFDWYAWHVKRAWFICNPVPDVDAALASARKEEEAVMAENQRIRARMTPIRAELDQHQDDYRAANDLARNPPADLQGDFRKNYIASKLNEARAAIESVNRVMPRYLAISQELQPASNELVIKGKLILLAQDRVLAQRQERTDPTPLENVDLIRKYMAECTQIIDPSPGDAPTTQPAK
jgi:hypothetical protein